jgi:hypothetical protein
VDSLTHLDERRADERTNGRADAPRAGQRGNRIANRTPWVRLDDPYDNLEVRVWLDYPQWVADLWLDPQKDETTEQFTARRMEACKNVFMDHRGEDGGPWEDDDGILPTPDNDDFWQRIPNQLAAAMIRAFGDELRGNPTNRASRRRKQKNWQRR